VETIRRTSAWRLSAGPAVSALATSSRRVASCTWMLSRSPSGVASPRPNTARSAPRVAASARDESRPRVSSPARRVSSRRTNRADNTRWSGSSSSCQASACGSTESRSRPRAAPVVAKGSTATTGSSATGVFGPRSAIQPTTPAAASAAAAVHGCSVLRRSARSKRSSHASTVVGRRSRATSSGATRASAMRRPRSGRRDRSAVASCGGSRATSGSVPVSASNATAARAYRSARASTSPRPLACSGAMYAGVPTANPLCVISVSPASSARATPKSVTSQRPVGSSRRMLEGLMSRCTTPRAWAKAKALPTCRSRSCSEVWSSDPRRARCCSSVSPSMSGITRYARSSRASNSNTWTMCGCERCAASAASRRKRAMRTVLAATSCGRTLIATFEPSFRWRPTNTAPMPPAASRRSTV